MLPTILFIGTAGLFLYIGIHHYFIPCIIVSALLSAYSVLTLLLAVINYYIILRAPATVILSASEIYVGEPLGMTWRIRRLFIFPGLRLIALPVFSPPPDIPDIRILNQYRRCTITTEIYWDFHGSVQFQGTRYRLTGLLGIISLEWFEPDGGMITIVPARNAAGTINSTHQHPIESAALKIRRRIQGDYIKMREYLPADDIRYINWKASAKTGSLIVREHEYYPPPVADLMVMLLPFLQTYKLSSAGQYRAVLEALCSMAARTIQLGYENGVRVYYYDCLHGRYADSQHESIDSMMRRLAGVQWQQPENAVFAESPAFLRTVNLHCFTTNLFADRIPELRRWLRRLAVHMTLTILPVEEYLLWLGVPGRQYSLHPQSLFSFITRPVQFTSVMHRTINRAERHATRMVYNHRISLQQQYTTATKKHLRGVYTPSAHSQVLCEEDFTALLPFNHRAIMQRAIVHRL